MAKKAAKKAVRPSSSLPRSSVVTRVQTAGERRAAAARRAPHVAPSLKQPKIGKMPKAATKPAPGGVRIRVKATKMGYYDHKRRRIDDVFTVREQDFSEKWMVPVLANTPGRQTGPQAALNKLRQRNLAKMAARQEGDPIDEESVVNEENDPDYQELEPDPDDPDDDDVI